MRRMAGMVDGLGGAYCSLTATTCSDIAPCFRVASFCRWCCREPPEMNSSAATWTVGRRGSRSKYSVSSQQSAVSSQQSAVSSQQSAVSNTQCSVLSAQYSVLSTQYSVLSAQCSILRTPYSVLRTSYSPGPLGLGAPTASWQCAGGLVLRPDIRLSGA